MVETQILHNIIDNHNILFTVLELNPKVQGVFDGRHDIPVIAINETIKHKPPLYRSVLAEEVGHYFTEFGHSEPKKNANYADKLIRARSEYRAHKWGANFLVPTKTLLRDLDSLKVAFKFELSLLYNVTVELLDTKFEAMARQQSYWKPTLRKDFKPRDVAQYLRYRIIISTNYPNTGGNRMNAVAYCRYSSDKQNERIRS